MIEPIPGLRSILSFNELHSPQSETLTALYRTTLLDPLDEFLARPKKGFRFELIQMAFQWAIENLSANSMLGSPVESDATSKLRLFSEVVELLHSGSLIVDDIEDQSKMRRGKQTLHELHGVPIALNAGNWLYF